MSRAKRLEEQLRSVFNPSYIAIEDESHKHSGPNQETHFKVTLVSALFIDTSRVKRHQAVYAQAAAELESGLHAIALHLYTPDEWLVQQQAPASPKCRGGE